jgi:hypothetical protein
MHVGVIVNTNILGRHTVTCSAVLLCFLFSACHNSAPPTAVLTFKSDGTHFAGTVVRREPTSITITGPSGDTHTFLYSELSNIQYGDTGAGSSASGAAPTGTGGAQSSGNQTQGASQPTSSADSVQLPAGITIPVTNNGLIDSTFVPENATLLAAMDSDAKGPDGRVLIPAGASVTLKVRESKVVAGRVTMQFELSTVDFGNRHYIVTSARGDSESGPVATVMGAAPGSPEAKLRGANLHLDDHSLMLFKAASPSVLRVSQ